MKLFVTGSTGFVGNAVVTARLERGHDVVALVRPATSLDEVLWAKQQAVTIARGDLRRRGGWEEELGACDAVIHLAAAGSGDFYTQFAATVLATENLLAAMAASGPRRLVHISSFSVYDYRAVRDGDPLDETSPLEARPTERDDYLQTKLIQEEMVRRFEREHDAAVTILRPGAIYGPGKLWNAGRAVRLGAPAEDAVRGLRDEAGDPAWEAMVTAILLQRTAGGDLAGLLRTLADGAEHGARAEAGARAALAQARATAQLIAGVPLLGFLGLAFLSPGTVAAIAARPAALGLLVAAALLGLLAGALLLGLARSVQR